MDYRRAKAKARKPTERQLKALKGLTEGKTIQAAMIDAGYSPNTAQLGVAGIPKTILELMPQECNLITLGRALTPESQADLVRGRLALNTLRGSDKGVNSAKALGSDRRVNMFTPEQQTGIIVVVPPAPVADKIDKLLESEE